MMYAHGCMGAIYERPSWRTLPSYASKGVANLGGDGVAGAHLPLNVLAARTRWRVRHARAARSFMIFSRKGKNVLDLSGFVKKSAWLSAVPTSGTLSSRASTRSRT